VEQSNHLELSLVADNDWIMADAAVSLDPRSNDLPKPSRVNTTCRRTTSSL
jgi:hypothetical protein